MRTMSIVWLIRSVPTVRGTAGTLAVAAGLELTEGAEHAVRRHRPAY
jgi:hypothetical protein